jgi:hypothetical protein
MKLYHLSTDDLDQQTLEPKVPDNILTKLGIENNTIPRVSFAPEIKYALLAIGYNRIKESTLKIFNVYEPDNYKTIKILTSKELESKDYVPDVDKTKEVWILNNVKLKYVGKIKVLNRTKEFISIKLGQNRELKNYYWNYKVIDGDLK